MKKKLTVLAMLGSLFAASCWAKDYNLQSAFPKNLVIIGEAADYFSKRVSVMSGAALPSNISELANYRLRSRF